MPIVKDREYRLILPLTAVTQTPPGGTYKRFDTDFYIEGYAATFDTSYLIGQDIRGVKYYERVDRNALTDADMSDVIMQYDHDGRVLARTGNQTLGIEADSKGLFVYADLSKSGAAKELYAEIQNGLITKMSWGFKIAEASYDRATRTRTVQKVNKVYDVSAVSLPANPDTEIAVRSFCDGVIAEERRETLGRRLAMMKLSAKLAGMKMTEADYENT